MVRNDLDPETSRSARPILVHRAIDGSPGLTKVAQFGDPVGPGDARGIHHRQRAAAAASRGGDLPGGRRRQSGCAVPDRCPPGWRGWTADPRCCFASTSAGDCSGNRRWGPCCCGSPAARASAVSSIGPSGGWPSSLRRSSSRSSASGPPSTRAIASVSVRYGAPDALRVVHPVDLHRRVARPQPAVGDETGQRARADGFAELRHLRRARAIPLWPGAPAAAAPTATSRGRGRCAPRHTKYLAGQAYPPGPRTAGPRRAAAAPNRARGWSPAGSAGSSRARPTGCRPAPAGARRGWCPTPGWRTARRAPPARGRRRPVLCSSSQSAVSCQYCGIASNAPGGVSRPVQASDVAARQRDQHHHADRHPLVASRGGRTPAPTRAEARCRATGFGPADEPARAPSAAAAAAPACACCAAGCRPRRGTPEPAGRQAIPARPSSRRRAGRRRSAVSR